MKKKNDLAHGFRLAREYSKQSTFKRVRIGCVAIYKNSLIAHGVNSYKTSPVQMQYNEYRGFEMEGATHSIHAEISCLSKIKYLDIDWSKLHLYIYREKCDKTIGMCRPCEACMAAIKDMGIRHIHYTTDDGEVYEKLKYHN